MRWNLLLIGALLSLVLFCGCNDGETDSGTGLAPSRDGTTTDSGSDSGSDNVLEEDE